MSIINQIVVAPVYWTKCVNMAISENSTFAKFLKSCLNSHGHGDWGNCSTEDQQRNTEALNDGSRIFSSYLLPEKLQNNDFGDYGRTEEKLWIITEAVGDDGKRSATTVLFPSEY